MRSRDTIAALLVAAGCAASADAQVIITEIMANEIGGDTPGEWVEIYNAGNSPVDISGWRFADEDSNSPSDPFPEGFVIEPGEAVVIIGDGFEEDNLGEPVIDEDDFFASWGATNADGNPYRVIVQRDPITLANTGSATNEVLTLIDSGGNPVDEANYQNGTDNWPPTTNGASIVLVADFLDPFANDFGCAWATAIVGVDGAVISSEVLAENQLGEFVLALSADNVGSPGYVASDASFVDCNGNGLTDALDICNGISVDCNGNGIPDECEPDCNGNGIVDACDIEADYSLDCNVNGIIDSCEIAGDAGLDADGNGRLDLCEQFENKAIITEIMFDPFSTGDEMEYVEILNITGAPLDISGWYLQDIEVNGEGPTDPIPAGNVLPAGGIAVLTRSVTGDTAETKQDYINAWGSATPGGDPILWIPLENWGARATYGTEVTEVLSIMSAAGTVVETVNYINRTSNSEPLPGGWPGGDGHSSYYLAGDKLSPIDNDSGPNWRRSTEGLSGAIRSNDFDGITEPTWAARFGEDFGSPGFIYAGAPQEPDGTVIITEIMATTASVFPGEDPSNPEALAGLDEWVEIYNTTGAAIDISGWYLQDEDGRSTGIAAGSVLEAGEVAVIIGNDFPAETGSIIAEYYDAWGCGYQVFAVRDWYTDEGYNGLSRLSDSPNFVNEILRIVDASGTPTDIVNFDDDAFVWPVDATGVNQDASWSIYLFGAGNFNSVSNDDGFVWADALSPIDGARVAGTNAVFNQQGNAFASPGHLEGVQVPDLNDCPDLPCNIADLAEPFGTLDLSDISAFVAAFTGMDPVVDFDANGVFDLTDISAFVSAFSGGCP